MSARKKANNADDFAERFDGVARLYGRAGLERLRAARVCVVGVGGVGSWAVEALARSGIGALTLIDLDDVCVTNVNWQLPALD
jgi:tRNA threonylcarbamoyladenosine dehydratase